MQIIYVLTKDLHISYEDFNNMPWYEILMIINQHQDFIERQEKESENQDDMIANQQAQMESMQRQQQQMMPKMDNYNIGNNFNMPNFNFPN